LLHQFVGGKCDIKARPAGMTMPAHVGDPLECRAEDVYVGARVELKAQKMGSVGFVGSGPVRLGPTPTPRAATYIELRWRGRPLAASGEYDLRVLGHGDAAHQLPFEPRLRSAGLGQADDRDLVGARLGHEQARALSGLSASATGIVPRPALRPTEIVRSTLQSPQVDDDDFVEGRESDVGPGAGLVDHDALRDERAAGPTVMSRRFAPVCRSTTDSVPVASLLTRPVCPSGRIAAPNG
jgi:hypothetical protein